MSTTPRIAFAVFRDEPEIPVVETKTDRPRSPTTYTIPPPTGPLLVYAPDKENVDPLSGSRALSEHALGKKRKTTLAVKSQPATSSPSKKPRPLAEKPTKKPAAKARSADKKTKRVSIAKRTGSGRTRREPSLPRLAEETEILDQAVIDSKCKELTVLPLADISEAYEQATVKDRKLKDDKVVDDKATAVIVEVERPVTPPSSLQETSASPFVASVKSFSTPERKSIYTAFTFSSPSPASKRLAGSTLERFSDAVL